MPPPSRGAWIEICFVNLFAKTTFSRPPRGGRGLKSTESQLGDDLSSRPPRGGRGLKYNQSIGPKRQSGRPPRGGRGLKFLGIQQSNNAWSSPPSRGAWIEIVNTKLRRMGIQVAPLAGGVD